MKASASANSMTAKKSILPRIKNSRLVEIVSALFILLFVYTAVSKLFEQAAFIWVLGKSPLIGKTGAPILAWVLPISELLISLLLLFPGTRRKGLILSFAAMLFFTLYIIYMFLFTPDLPCSCGGALKQLTWTQHLIFNIVFLLLALLALQKGKTIPDQNRHDL